MATTIPLFTSATPFVMSQFNSRISALNDAPPMRWYGEMARTEGRVQVGGQNTGGSGGDDVTQTYIGTANIVDSGFSRTDGKLYVPSTATRIKVTGRVGLGRATFSSPAVYIYKNGALLTTLEYDMVSSTYIDVTFEKIYTISGTSNYFELVLKGVNSTASDTRSYAIGHYFQVEALR